MESINSSKHFLKEKMEGDTVKWYLNSHGNSKRKIFTKM